MGWFDFLIQVEMPDRVAVSRLETAIRSVADGLRAEREQEERKETVVDGAMYKSSPESIKVAIAESMKREDTFGRYLIRMVARLCDGRAVECYKRAGLSRQVYSRAVSGGSVSRETAMRLALGLQLSYLESVDLLEHAGYTFRPTEVPDAVFAYCLKNGIYNIFDVNEMLVALGVPPLKIY